MPYDDEVHLVGANGDGTMCGQPEDADGVFLEITHKGPSRRKTVTCPECLHAEIDWLVVVIGGLGGAPAVRAAGYSPEEAGI